MNTLTGYSKSTLTDSYLLTAAGGHIAASDFATWKGVIQTDSSASGIAASNTADFLKKIHTTTKLFNTNFSAFRGSHYWLGNYDFDTGVGNLELGGAAVLNISLNTNDNEYYKSLLFLDYKGDLYSYVSLDSSQPLRWSRYAKSTEIPTKTSQLTNDSGFLTSRGYWADVAVSSSSNKTTTPTFATATATTQVITPKVHSNGRLTLNATNTGLDLKWNDDNTKSVILNGTAFKPFDDANDKLTLGSINAKWSHIYAALTVNTPTVTSPAVLNISAGSTEVQIQVAATSTQSVVLNTTSFGPFKAANGLLSSGRSDARWSNIYSVLGNFTGSVTIKKGNSILDENGWGIVGINPTGWTGLPSDGSAIGFGTGAAPVYIRTDSDNLYHYHKTNNASYKILDSNNSSISGDGGSTWGSSITVKINGTSKTLTIPSNPNTDTKVTLTVTSSNASYPLLLAPSGQTATTTTSAYFDSGVTLNPSTNTIAANISGSAAKLHSNSAKNVGGLTYNYAGGITSSTDATGAFAGPSTSTTYSSVLRLLSHITSGGLYYRDLIFDVNSDSIWSRRVTNSGTPSLTSILHSGNSSVSGGGSSWGSSITVKINGEEKTLTIPNAPTIPSLSLGTTTGSGNAVTSISVDGHKITLNKGTTFSLSGHTHSHLVSGATLSGSDHAAALKTYFTNNKSSIPRNSLNTYYSSARGNGSLYFGYFLTNYNDTPYGGFYVAHYNTPYYVGIAYGTFTQYLLAKITDITKSQVGLSNVQNTAFYKRITTVNGTLWDMAGTNSNDAFTIYAPTTGGTAGYILKSNKDAAPTWIALSDISAGKLGGYEESKFLRGKSWMPAGTINDHLHGIYATGTNITDVPKDANGNNLTYSTVLSFDALVGSGYGKVLFYVKSAQLYYRHYWDSKWYDWYLIALKSNIPTKVSQLLNDSGYLTTRGYIGTTSVLASSVTLKLKGINGLYLSEDSSSALNNKGVNFCNSAGNIKHSIGATSSGLGIYSSGTLWLRAGCTASTSVDTALTSSNTGLVLDASGNLTVSGAISASNFSGVGNGKITIKLNNTEIGSFTMNQSIAGTINLTDTTYSLVGANGTTGLIKNGSTVTTTTGLTACPIINGVPYYKELSKSGITAGTYETYAEKWNSTAMFLLLKIPQFTVNEYGILTNATYTATPIIRTHYIASNLTWTNDKLSFINVFAIIPGVTLTLPGASIENCGKLIFAKKAYLGSAAYISGYITSCNNYGTSASTKSIDLINSTIFVCMNNGSNYSWVHFYCG